MTDTTTLRAFLDTRRVTSPHWNITGMGTHAGKYTVADADYGPFLQLVHDHVFVRGQPAHLLERHPPVASPILMDLDLHYADDDPTLPRLYTDADVRQFMTTVLATVHKFIAHPEPARFIVQAIPTPVRDAAHSRRKDGLHIVCPDLVLRYADLFTLRKILLENTDALDAFRHRTNSAADCLDESVIQRNNWFLYGCSKSPDRAPYRAVTAFVLDPDGTVSEEPVEDSPQQLLVQCSLHGAIPTEVAMRAETQEEWTMWSSLCDAKPTRAAPAASPPILALVKHADDAESVASHRSETISKLIQQPGLIWTIAEEGDGYKLTHNSKRCLVAPTVDHTTIGHSCVFVTARSACLVCFSHKSKRLPKPIATALWNVLSGDGTTADQLTERYETLKTQFERHVFRILDPPGYMAYVSGRWVHYNRAQLLDTNSGLFVDEEKKTRFIDMWLRDDRIRTYARMGYYVDPAECPPTEFNTFEGFAGARAAANHPEDVDISMILKHISILCHHQADAMEYVLDWFAAIVQHPSFLNGVALVFIGPQGCGKDTFLSWFSTELIGHTNYFNTSRPHVDLFGAFNSSRKNIVFYHIEEGNQVAMSKENVEQFKSYITDPHAAIQIKNKNTTASESLICNYNHFAISTNNNVPFHIDANERRFFAIRSSTEVSKQWAYFNALRQHMSQPAVVATFYRFLMARPVAGRNWGTMPVTEALTTWKTECMPVLASFIEWFKSTRTIPCTARASEFYAAYSAWCDETEEELLSQRAFGLEVRNLNCVMKEHSRNGTLYKIL